MNAKQFKAAVRKATWVFAWVNYTRDDGRYIRISKTATLDALAGPDVDATLRDDGDLYIG